MRWKKAGAGLLFCLLFAVIFGCLSGNASTAQFAGGSGTEADPYKITTPAHLNNVRNYPEACFVLCNDIVFTDGDFSAGGAFYNGGNGWNPIGYGGTLFTGTLDGKGYSIKNLQLYRNGDISYAYLGLFSVIRGEVKDLHMIGVKIHISSGDPAVAGGIAGATLGTLTGCSVDGEISVKSSNFSRVGGVSGITDPKAYFWNNVNKSSVSASGGTVYAGGVVGHLRGTVAECINLGSVTVNKGSISRAGGIVGYLQQGEIRNCFNVGAVTIAGTGRPRSAGGIVGTNNGTVNTSYNAGSLKIEAPAPTSNDGIGGIVGTVEEEAQHNDCYYLSDAYQSWYGESLSAARMKSAGAFPGFDFSSVWTMEGNADYRWPELRKAPLEECPHHWDERVIAASCTQNGKSTLYCAACVRSETKTIPATGHTFSDWWDSVHPSCTEGGTQTRSCSSCSVTETRTTAPAGHKFSDWWDSEPASCTGSGTQMRRCSVCNATEARTTDPLGHRYSGEYVSKIPTCTEPGIHTVTCTVCRTSVTEEIPPTGHDFSEWSITKPPSCEDPGAQERICNTCNRSETATVPPVGHHFLDPEILQLPTCTEPGTEQGECTRCEEYTSQQIPPTGHTFGEEQIIRPATETEAGLSEHTCTVCGEAEQTVIPKLSAEPDPNEGDPSTDPANPSDTTISHRTDPTDDLKNPREWIYWALGGAWSVFAAGAWLFLRH